MVFYKQYANIICWILTEAAKDLIAWYRTICLLAHTNLRITTIILRNLCTTSLKQSECRGSVTASEHHLHKMEMNDSFDNQGRIWSRTWHTLLTLYKIYLLFTTLPGRCIDPQPRPFETDIPSCTLCSGSWRILPFCIALNFSTDTGKTDT